MISVTFDMIFKSVVFSLLLGAVSGLIYSVLHVFSSFFTGVAFRLFKKKKRTLRRSFLSNLFDFLFFLSVGTAYILVLYASTDGVFYLISLVSLSVGFGVVSSIVSSLPKKFK